MKNYQLVQKLAEKGYHICFAESCTGGMLCSLIVDVPMASSVLDMSFVTYANEAKTELLFVDEQTISSYGVVSEQVTEQMCRGAAKRSGAQVAVSVSGIAGPTGGSDKKPVGTVCFGFYVCGEVTTSTMLFSGLDRSGVRKAACEYAIDTILKLL